jgi:PUB domain
MEIENISVNKPYASTIPQMMNNQYSTAKITPGLRQEIEENLNRMYQTNMVKENLVETLKIMDKLISNIIKNPTDTKFRSINLENKTLKATIGSS